MSDKPCTCHPDDNPPVPCPQKFALSECKAAPAPDADAIMALADTVAFRCDRYGINHAGQARELLRAAVEQLYAEAQMTALHREAANQAVERARRAERERDELRALLNACRLYVETSSMDGRELLARIDALLKGPSQEGLSTTKESQHGEGQEGR